MSETIRVFIGYEPSETIAFHVLAHSIYRHARGPVSVTGLFLRQLPLRRERDPHQSTEFAFSRFLVPHLCRFQGTAVFMDCDMLCRADVTDLIAAADLSKPVSVVKHDYIPKADRKFLDHEQTSYQRKNWSSVMVFNCEACAMLTPQYVDRTPGLDLHQFAWLDQADPFWGPDREGRIGALPPEWNHLVGEYSSNSSAKLVHFTLGGPWFAKYRFCEFAGEWFEERDRMLYYERRGEFSKPERVVA